MKAIAITQAAADGNNIPSLTEIDLPIPTAHGRDLLVAVKAISVNPVDTKVRAGFQGDTPRVLGWDAVGVVQSVGEEVTLFAPGDEVWYAGALGRAGSNSEYQLVDERLVAHKPRTLDNASAAALPLTAITAWELLFHRLGVEEGGNAGDTLLIVGAAGGVGSILTQLASKLTAMTVIGTASRPESQQWVREAGAHHVIDHSKPLADELARIGITSVTHVASLTNTEQHFNALIDALAPQGKLALIDDPETLDVVPLKAKSLSLHWEFMFTRSMFETDDMIAQHQLLTRVAALIDNHTIKTTLANTTAPSPPPICRKRIASWKPDAPSARSCWRGFKMISLIAVLKAKPGQTDALRQALQALLLPTRQEPGNLDYALFQLRDAPDTFYMREAWQGQDALDAHVAMPYFQAFMTQMESLLAEPLRLDFLTPVEP